MTGERPLLAWSRRPSRERGIHFAGAGEEWDFWSYERLAVEAFAVGRGMVAAGVEENRVVAVLNRSGPDFVATLFGTMLAGAIPSPVAPPLTFGDWTAYEGHLRSILAAARPALLVTDPELVPVLDEGVGHGGPPAITAASLRELAGDAASPPDRTAADLALLQFTSGSTGPARGVRVPFAALEANVAAIHRWLRWTAEDVVASWLPLHHDMGLVGCFLGSILAGSDLRLLRPERFIREPLGYLRCFGCQAATMTAIPTSGLEYLLRRVRPDELAGCDFTGWRAAIVGAERVDPHVLGDFEALLRPFGLRPGTLIPAYGLAEATLAVTGVPPGEHWSGLAAEPGSLTPGEVVRPVAAGAGPALVGCGPPLAGVEVTIEGPGGERLGDGVVGEIVVRGASLAGGYLSAGSSPATRFEEGGLRTGDAGFLDGGELYVLGRLGDSLKIRGRSVFAEQLEAVLVASGIPSRRLVVLLGSHGGEAQAVVLLERPEAAWLTTAAELVGPRVEGAGVVLVEVGREGMQRTSSGKPRRRQLWRAYQEGSLAGTVIGRSQGDPRRRRRTW